MDVLSLLLSNKIFLEVIYSFIISFICLAISFKSDRYFRLSLHSGLRYFRNAFFFYGLAFFWKFCFAELTGLNSFSIFFSQFIFESLLIMGGLFLLYSLLWKKFNPKPGFSSLINSKLIFLYLLSLVIALTDCLKGTYFLLFSSQTLIFLIAFILVLNTYKQKGNKPSFLKFYGLAIALGLIAWILNFATAFVFQWDLLLLISTGLLNIIFFLIVLLGILQVTNKIKKQ